MYFGAKSPISMQLSPISHGIPRAVQGCSGLLRVMVCLPK